MEVKRNWRIKEDEFLINEKIRVPQVRLVGENAPEDGAVYYTDKALELAREMELDLVLITDKSNPPVCRIVDYKKFIYEKKKKEKEIKANTVKTVIKEIRFGPNTDQHDFEFKLNHAKKFLKEGSKVKAYVHFKGRAIVHKDRGEILLLKFVQELEDYGKIEAMPKLEGKRMFVMIDVLKVSSNKK